LLAKAGQALQKEPLMADQGHSGGEGPGFLPPEPPGPEPELGDKAGEPTQPLPPTQPQQQYQPPPQYQQPPPQYQQPPPRYQQAPPQPWEQPYGYGPPPGHYAWGPPPPREPDNNPAVAGFVLSMVGGGLLFFFAGLSTIISLGLSIAGIVYSRKGKEKVDKGETTKQRGLAQAGFIVGIVSTVLSLLATAFWIIFVVLVATDEEFRRELEDGNSGTIAIALVRGLVSLL
jgi:hypothetical protein